MSDPVLATGPWWLGRILAGLVVVIAGGTVALGSYEPAAYSSATASTQEPTAAPVEVTSGGYGSFVSQPDPTRAPASDTDGPEGTDVEPESQTVSTTGATSGPAGSRAAARALVRRTEAQQRRWQQRVDRELAAFLESSSGASGDATAPAASARTVVAAPASAPTTWVTPLRAAYRVTATFGQAGSRWSRTHTGLDLAAPTGTAVHAVAAGRVVSAGWNGAYGQKVAIVHDDGTRTWYAHLSHVGVAVGQTVAAGQQIGAVGTTGNVTGPHLHLEVRTGGDASGDGTPIDPRQALAARGVTV